MKLLKQTLISFAILSIETEIPKTQPEQTIPLKSQQPLGIAFDGTVLWSVDVRSKVLEGYHIEEKRRLSPKKLKIAGIRDIAFWNRHIVSAYKQYIFLIDPINGNLVDKWITKFLKDPISLAVEGDIAYIYDKSKNRFFRYDLRRRLSFGTFKKAGFQPKGASYHRGFLWTADENGLISKINPDTGETEGFIPLSKKTYGLVFIKGGLYISQPNLVKSIDYFETDYYVSASPVLYDFTLGLKLSSPNSKVTARKRAPLKTSFLILPSGVHQRFTLIDLSDQKIHKERTANGEFKIECVFSGEKNNVKFKIRSKAVIYNTYYYFTKATEKVFFETYELDPELLNYTRLDTLDVSTLKRARIFFEKKKTQIQNLHPHRVLRLLYQEDKKNLAFQIALFRLKGVPTRRINIYDLRSKKFKDHMSLYIKPVGWVPVTKEYDPEFSNKFPIRNHLLELSIPDSFAISPNLNGLYKLNDLLQWEQIDFRLQEE